MHVSAALHQYDIRAGKYLGQGDVLKDEVPFDLERYKALLKKYKNRKPEKVYELLES